MDITFTRFLYWFPVNAEEEVASDTWLLKIIQTCAGDAHSAKDMNTVATIGTEKTFAGKGAPTTNSSQEELIRHNWEQKNIKELRMDMSPAFMSAVVEHLLKTEVTFDKFHAVTLLNKALDKVHRTELEINSLLINTRYMPLKTPHGFTLKQQKNLAALSKETLKMAKIYRMKLTLRSAYSTINDRAPAKELTKRWLFEAVCSGLGLVAGMFKAHLKDVHNYFSSRLTAKASETIRNQIQQTRSEDNRNRGNFIGTIFLKNSGNVILNLFGTCLE
ncbi:MAG: transposase [bacterium]|nr:transposase [bacterium]